MVTIKELQAWLKANRENVKFCQPQLLTELVLMLTAVVVDSTYGTLYADRECPAADGLLHLVAPEMLMGMARAGQWPKVRAEHLEKEPRCVACGGTKLLNVHHVRPYHLYPKLELVEKNLVTLCEYHGCHLVFGHFYDFSKFNPHVRADATSWFQRASAARR